MARKKQKGISMPKNGTFPTAIVPRRRKLENGETEHYTEEVIRLDDAADVVAFQEWVSENGPEGYTGDVLIRDLLNSFLSGTAIGEKEIPTAPVTRYIDPAQAALDELMSKVRSGNATAADLKKVTAMFAEVAE